MSRIRIRGGRWFDFLNPDSTPLTIDDIAWGLAHEFRYSNQGYEMLTVAQHSCMASGLRFVPPEYKRGMLFHDASEAVLHDLASPLKKLLPDYQEIESRIQESILKSLGVRPAPESLIAEADQCLLEEEMAVVFSDDLGQDRIWSSMRSYHLFNGAASSLH